MYEMDNLTPEERTAFKRMRELQFAKVVNDGAIFSQPISEGGTNWTSEPIKTNCRRVDGGWLISSVTAGSGSKDDTSYWLVSLVKASSE